MGFMEGGWDWLHRMLLPQCCIPSLQQVAQMCAAVVLTVVHSQILHARNPRVSQNMLRKQQPNSYKYNIASIYALMHIVIWLAEPLHTAKQLDYELEISMAL